MEKWTLHHCPASRSARVLWMLHETVGGRIRVESIDLYAGVQYTAEFLARNPNHGVPVLEIVWDDGTPQVMIESAAIVAFLADAYPEKGLAPAAGRTRERADYLQMLHFCSNWADMMLWQIRIHEDVLPEAQRDPRTVARYRGKFAGEVEPQLARRLAAHPYICGDRFTAADCVAAHIVMWARGYGLCREETFRRYLSTVSKRPAFVEAFADARQFAPQLPPGSPLPARFTG
jgi:glutathione S-transferase